MVPWVRVVREERGVRITRILLISPLSPMSTTQYTHNIIYSRAAYNTNLALGTKHHQQQTYIYMLAEQKAVATDTASALLYALCCSMYVLQEFFADFLCTVCDCCCSCYHDISPQTPDRACKDDDHGK